MFPTPAPKARVTRDSYAAKPPAQIELVEPRQLLSGNVTASLVNGHLQISGDAADNDLRISFGANRSLSFSSETGTTVNGEAADSVNLVGDVTRITVSSRDGDDTIVLEDALRNKQRLAGDVRIIGGRGKDRIALRGLDIGGDVLVTGGVGSDWVVAEALDIDGDVVISGGRGWDRLTVREVNVDGDLTISGGQGQDVVITGEGVSTNGTGRVSAGLEPDTFFSAADAPEFVRGRALTRAQLDRQFEAIGGDTREDLERSIDRRRPLNDVTFLSGFPEFDPTNFQTTASGLRYRIIDAGTGEPPAVTDVVDVDLQALRTNGGSLAYAGRNGSRIHLDLAEYPDGLAEGLGLIGEGGQIQILVPAALAYGEAGVREQSGAGYVIPPGASLFYNLTLHEITRATDVNNGSFTQGFPDYTPTAFTRTASGLQYRIIRDGNAARATTTSNVAVHYEGFLEDGTLFDSSFARGTAAQFNLSLLIRGWQEGLQLIGEGGLIQLRIPSDLAYGPGGTRGIPGNSTLFFNLQLNEVLSNASA